MENIKYIINPKNGKPMRCELKPHPSNVNKSWVCSHDILGKQSSDSAESVWITPIRWQTEFSKAQIISKTYAELLASYVVI
ncbi:MAG: hypothetical protein R3321_11170 [Nitrososphaeraceae archaeon]|nr:hypothetical protein [Nitrososphaeraceae archaeon]